MRKKPAAVSTSTTNWIAAGGEAAFGLQFVDDVGDGLDVFGAVHLGEHQRRDARDHRGFEVAHQQAPGTIDAHQHVGALAGDLRNGVGDQGARTFLLRWGDGVLEVEDDAIGAAVGAGLHEFIGGDGHEEKRTPGWKVGAHVQVPVIARSEATKQSPSLVRTGWSSMVRSDRRTDRASRDSWR